MGKLDKIIGSLKPYNNRLAWGVVILLSAVYILRTNSMFLFQGGDNAYYVLLAKALAAGEGYRDMFRAGAPPHTMYPPMFPLMLSGIIVIHGVDIYLMKMIVSLGVAATLALTFILLRRQSFGWPLATVVFLGCSIRIFSYSDDILTETVYMAFSISALVTLDKWLKEDKWIYVVLTIASCWAAEMTRTAGMTLAAAIGVGVFFGKGKSKKAVLWAIALAIFCFIPLAAWSLRNRMVSGVATNYISQFLAIDAYDPTKGRIGLIEFLERVLKNLKWHFLDTAGFLGAENIFSLRILNPVADTLSWIYAILIMSPLMGLGFYHRVRRGITAIEAYTIFFLCMTMSWPFAGYRYIMPAYPFITAYTIEGARHLSGNLLKARPITRKAVLWFFAILFFLIIAIDAVNIINYERNTTRQFERTKIQVGDGIYAMAKTVNYEHLLGACRWLARYGEPGAIVMARKPTLTALASAHPVIDIPMVTPSDPKKWLEENNVRYIIVDEIYPQAYKFMEAFTEGWTIQPGAEYTISFRIEDTVIIEFKH